MQKVGRRFYYDKVTGEIIYERPEQIYLTERHEITVEQDMTSILVLKQRVPGTFEVLELEYGDYGADFAEAQLKGIDPETKELRFEYPNPETPSEPTTPAVPLSKQLEDVRNSMDSAILELSMLIAMGGMNNV